MNLKPPTLGSDAFTTRPGYQIECKTGLRFEPQVYTGVGCFYKTRVPNRLQILFKVTGVTGLRFELRSSHTRAGCVYHTTINKVVNLSDRCEIAVFPLTLGRFTLLQECQPLKKLEDMLIYGFSVFPFCELFVCNLYIQPWMFVRDDDFMPPNLFSFLRTPYVLWPSRFTSSVYQC